MLRPSGAYSHEPAWNVGLVYVVSGPRLWSSARLIALVTILHTMDSDAMSGRDQGAGV